MDIVSLQHIQQNFLKELENSEKGEKTSFAYLVNFIPTPFVTDNEVFQVLVIGGSNCKNALMKKVQGTYTIISQTEKTQPIFHTKDDFLTFIDTEIDPHVTYVALNFAYPLQPEKREGKLEGTLLYGTKEHTFAGLTGEKVGETIEHYIHKKRNQTINVCVANDTICLLLSGLTKVSWETLAGAIVGTGYNLAFFTSGHEAINLESGGFANMPQDSIDKTIDTTSNRPGDQINEKQVSGAYLYQYFNLLAKERNITTSVDSTESLDKLARGDDTGSDLAKQVIKRSAMLVAAQLAAISAHTKATTFVVEGSLFWKAYQYKQTVEQTLQTLLPEKTISFLEIDNSSIFGGAKLIS